MCGAAIVVGFASMFVLCAYCNKYSSYQISYDYNILWIFDDVVYDCIWNDVTYYICDARLEFTLVMQCYEY